MVAYQNKGASRMFDLNQTGWLTMFAFVPLSTSSISSKPNGDFTLFILKIFFLNAH